MLSSMSAKPDTETQSNPSQDGQVSKNQSAETNALGDTKDDEEFVDVSHKDVDMEDTPSEGSRSGQRGEPGLHRVINIEDMGLPLEDDDSDDDNDPMSHHPLLNMLTGRLGQRRRGSTHKWDYLHPVTTVLSPANAEECAKLEEKAFPEEERASHEKISYRLTKCPELSLGLISQPTKLEAEKAGTGSKQRIIAHVISTRTSAPAVTDASMGLPSNWRQRKSSIPGPDEKDPQGHQDIGGTICIHSLAVTKEYQRIGLGTVLLKSYIQRIRDSKSADRIALLAHDHLKDYYTGFGFEDMGPSSVTGCGGGWTSMILELSHQDED